MILGEDSDLINDAAAASRACVGSGFAPHSYSYSASRYSCSIGFDGPNASGNGAAAKKL